MSSGDEEAAEMITIMMWNTGTGLLPFGKVRELRPVVTGK